MRLCGWLGLGGRLQEVPAARGQALGLLVRGQRRHRSLAAVCDPVLDRSGSTSLLSHVLRCQLAQRLGSRGLLGLGQLSLLTVVLGQVDAGPSHLPAGQPLLELVPAPQVLPDHERRVSRHAPLGFGSTSVRGLQRGW